MSPMAISAVFAAMAGSAVFSSAATSPLAGESPDIRNSPRPRLAIVRAAASSEAGLSYAIQLQDGRELLAASPAALRFFVHNRWCAVGRGGGLTLVSQRAVASDSPTTAESPDGLGPFTGHESRWQCDGVPIVLGIYAHPGAGTVRFTQTFPDGATGTSVVGPRGNGGRSSQPFGQHPTINTSSGLLGNMTFFAVSGNMNEYRERGIGVSSAWGGSGKAHQRLPDTGGYHPDGQYDSGPFLLFEEPEQGLGVHVVVSPLNNFFVWSQAIVQAGDPEDSPPPAAQQSSQCSGLEQDCDLSGGDIRKNGALNPIPCQSAAACCALCNANVECTDFTWIGPKEKQKPYVPKALKP